jgi:hypothetical protein
MIYLMARGLLEHDIFDLLGNGNISKLDFLNKETDEHVFYSLTNKMYSTYICYFLLYIGYL